MQRDGFRSVSTDLRNNTETLVIIAWYHFIFQLDGESLFMLLPHMYLSSTTPEQAGVSRKCRESGGVLQKSEKLPRELSLMGWLPRYFPVRWALVRAVQ